MSGTRQRPTSAARVMKERRDMVARAAEEGMSNLVLFALEECPEENTQQLAQGQGPKDVPLVTACLHGHLEVVQNLVEKCHTPVNTCGDVTIEGEEYQGVPALWAAVESGNEPLVRYLVQRGANVNKRVPLRVAVFHGHVAISQFLLENGADVNGVNPKGHSVLMNSCQNGSNFTEIVRQLLQKDADVNYVDPLKGETALHEAARCGAVETGKLLIAQGASITRNRYGETPLLVAALERKDDFVKFLLNTPDFSRDDQADALELLGTSYLLEEKSDRCLDLWERAMTLRYEPGKPVAEKRKADETVAAYGHAEEAQTMKCLQRLRRPGSQSQLTVQNLLVRERVLGKENPDTTYIIKLTAGIHADKHDHTHAIHLLLHTLDNIKGLFPFDTHTLGVYELLLGIMVESEESDTKMPFSLLLQPLMHVLSDFQRGEEAQKEEKNETCLEMRQNLLKIVLHMISLLYEARPRRAQPEEGTQFSQAVSGFAKTGVRGKGGNTLLHMACEADTTNFDTSDVPYNGYRFPSLSAVRPLLEAGCDVTAQNEAGQTALQVVRKEKGDNAEIIRLLMEAGSA